MKVNTNEKFELLFNKNGHMHICICIYVWYGYIILTARLWIYMADSLEQRKTQGRKQFQWRLHDRKVWFNITMIGYLGHNSFWQQNREEKLQFLSQFRWSLLPSVKFTINLNCPRYCASYEKRRHYQYQLLISIPTNACILKPQCVKGELDNL